MIKQDTSSKHELKDICSTDSDEEEEQQAHEDKYNSAFLNFILQATDSPKPKPKKNLEEIIRKEILKSKKRNKEEAIKIQEEKVTEDESSKIDVRQEKL